MSMYMPPGNLRDFDAIAGQDKLWHQCVQGWFRDAIHDGKTPTTAGTGAAGIPQFYDAFDAHDPALPPAGGTIGQDIVWNAFPRELLRRFGRKKAMRVADDLWPLPAYGLGWKFDPDRKVPPATLLAQLLAEVPSADRYPADCVYRPQTEYCEWRVEWVGKPADGGIRSVTFTCEPPEYWQAMFGGPVQTCGTGPSPPFVFPGCRDVVLALYRRWIDAKVDLQDLLDAGPKRTSPIVELDVGVYNPYNRWNTTDGIAHLCAPPNALMAEVLLAAPASRTYCNANKQLVVLPEVLVNGAGLGSANRNSDVAIASAVNALARQGRRITLANPLGIGMDGIDVAGWKFPGKLTADDCIHILRGEKGQAMRLEVRMPSDEYLVSDILIGGEPIRHGGQIAECITVKLRAVATKARDITNDPFPMTYSALVDPCGGGEVFFEDGVQPPKTAVGAFHQEGSPKSEKRSTPTLQSRADLDEPVLELEQIQGLAVPGFMKPSQTLLCVQHEDDADTVRRVKNLLRQLQPHISTGLATLNDRNAFRKSKEDGQVQAGQVLVGIGFTFLGLRCLTTTADGIHSPAFRQGLAARSALLGDPTTAGEPGHPSRWVVGSADDKPRFMLVVAGQDRELVNQKVEQLAQLVKAAGLDIERQDGDKLDTSSKSREHFGFVDGISQPGIRGRVSDGPEDFITPQRIADWPASGLYGYPGQDLVWPGEFVLGYARTGPDPLMPGPMAEPDVDWMENGSYLVYNRLLQDVGLFWQTMAAEASRLAKRPGFEDITAEGLASRLVGRTRNGVPVSRLQGSDQAFHEGMGAKPHANNHFRFDSDTPRLPLLEGTDTYPQAKADPLGMVCPLASHVRKVNPRDSASDVGGESSNLQHRILRTGVPFGEKRKKLKSEPELDEPERGQLFLCIQASIEAQFEFLQSRWMNHDMRPKAPGGHDMLAGRMPSDGGATRRCTIFGAQGQQEQVSSDKPFVTSSGGGYFFVPSLGALKDVLSAEPRPASRSEKPHS